MQKWEKLALPFCLNSKKTHYVPGSLPFKPAVVQNPDGTMEFYTYAANGSLIAVAQGQPDGNKSGIWNGRKTTTLRGAQGEALEEETQVVVEGKETVTITHDQIVNDKLGRPQRITHMDGTVDASNYDCCGVASETDRCGA
jgi:hypothetical protein